MELPREALTVLDAVAAGRRERAESSRPRGGGGAISEAVASALSSHPAGVDSSTREGAQYTGKQQAKCSRLFCPSTLGHPLRQPSSLTGRL